MDEPLARVARGDMPVRIFRLGDEPTDDLRPTTTPAQRFEMVAELSARMLEFSAQATTSYTRTEMPVRMVPPASAIMNDDWFDVLTALAVAQAY